MLVVPVREGTLGKGHTGDKTRTLSPVVDTLKDQLNEIG